MYEAVLILNPLESVKSATVVKKNMLKSCSELETPEEFLVLVKTRSLGTPDFAIKNA